MLGCPNIPQLGTLYTDHPGPTVPPSTVLTTSTRETLSKSQRFTEWYFTNLGKLPLYWSKGSAPHNDGKLQLNGESVHFDNGKSPHYTDVPAPTPQQYGVNMGQHGEYGDTTGSYKGSHKGSPDCMDYVFNSLTIHNQSTPRQLQGNSGVLLSHFHSTLTASMEFRCPSFYLTSGCTFARVFTPFLLLLDWKQLKPYNSIYTTSNVGQQHYTQRPICPTPVVHSPGCLNVFMH